MEPLTKPADFDEAPDSRRCPHGHRRRGFLAGILLGALGAGLVGFAIGAAAPVAEAAFGLMGRHQEHERGGEHDGPPTPAEARDHAEFFVAFALHRLDATPEQQDKALKIVDTTVDQLFPVIEKHRANRTALRGILGAQPIDRNAIEKLRVEELALADSMSRVIAKSLGDAADVLTLEQRLQLLDRLEEFHHRP